MSKSKRPEITLGSDPELHLFHRKKGRVVNAIPVLGCNKKNPTDLGNGIRVYADNVLVEAAFPPSTSVGEIVETFGEAFRRISRHIGEEYELLPKASVEYPAEELDDKAAWEVGCNPNFDAYKIRRGKAAANMPADFTDGVRTGSFHLHIGHPSIAGEKGVNFDAKHKLVRLMDIFVGCSSVIFDKDDSAPARRRLYGKAGEHRPTPYGIEYRVLGNFPLRSPAMVEMVYELAMMAFDALEDGFGDHLLRAADQKRVVEAINGNKAEIAESLLKQAEIPGQMMRLIKHPWNPEFRKEWGIA